MTRKQQIIMGHLNGESNRKIALRLHVSRDTVNKYVQEYTEKREAFLSEHPDGDAEEILQAYVEGPKYDTSSRKPVKVTEELREEIAACLRSNEEKRATGRHKQQMRKKDIHSYLAKKGYGVSYSTVKRHRGEDMTLTFLDLYPQYEKENKSRRKTGQSIEN